MLSVILPTINEAPSVRALIPELLGLDGVSEVIVVDDGSTDGTPELVRELGEADERVRLLERSGRPGLTAAIWDGIQAARSPHVAWMDADGSMLPSDLARLHAALCSHDADIVVGSRFVDHGRIKGQSRPGLLGRIDALTRLGDSKDAWYGVLLSWGFNAVVMPLLLRGGVHDYTSGFAVARRELLLELGLRGDYGEYFIDLWVRSERAGSRIVELGYAIQSRSHGESKTAGSFAGFLWRGRRYLSTAWRLRATRPST